MTRKDVNVTVTMNTNTVFIGDICYALDEEIYHKKWGDCLNWADGKIQAEGNGDSGPVCAVVGSTATGDGCYEGSDGTVFGVDAGVIGVTNLKYLRDDENIEGLNQLGKVIDIPGGECFVTLIDEGDEFYIGIEDMQHNKIYSVNIPTGASETPTCIECGAEISDFENYQYGGVCEDCYRYQDYEDEEDLDECCTLGEKALKENSLTSDKVLVRVHVPNDYYDKFGNPVNAEKYDVRLEEIDNALFEAGAEAVWEVTSNPEAGWEGDDFSDTGFRRMTVAQLRVAIENGGIEEDEIRVYDNDIDVDRDNWTEYMNQHPEIDPWDHTADFDIYEDHRIYDINSLIYDADDDLDESCTSGEFQRMAPGKVVSMTAYKGSKKALGKKDKYNRLGESNKLAEATGSFPIRKVAASPRWITDTGKETIWITAEINGIPCAFPFIAGYGPTAEGCDCNECIVNYEMQFYNRDRIDTSKGKRISSVADGGGARYYFLKFGESILKSMPKENQKDFRFTGHYYSTRHLVVEFKKLITTAFNTDLLTEEFKSAIGL